jgi:hypothetical protein
MKEDYLDNNEIPKEELEQYKVTTGTLFKKHFAFAEVAKNDFAAEQLDTLDIAEKNFNADIDNKDLLKTFVATACTVRDKLKTKYAD